MSNDLNFYINGEWVKSESNETIDVINPANEEVIGQVAAGTKDDIMILFKLFLKKWDHQSGCQKQRKLRLELKTSKKLWMH